MRSKSLLWIAVLQVLAGLGATAPASAATQPATPLRVLCLHLEEPSATGLRLLAEQSGLVRQLPGLRWPMLLGILTVPANILLWEALLRTVLGEPAPAHAQPLRRATVASPSHPEAGLPRGWSFPSTSAERRNR